MTLFSKAVPAIFAAIGLAAASYLAAAPGAANAADKERALTNRSVSVGGAEAHRVALVIGNSRYRNSPLQNPANDARAMSETLKWLGFDVVTALDADRQAMQTAILSFADKLANGGVGVFYYAGHGVQVRGLNYLIPLGHKITSEASVRFEAIRLDAVLEQMGQPRPNRTNVVILDACRNNPFANRFSGSGAGLALVDAPTDFLVAYATAPGAVALDGAANEANGVYTAAILKSLKVPNLRVEDVFKRVRAEVSFKTQRKQIPWEASSLVRDFVFNNPEDRKPKSVQSAGLSEKQVESIVRKVQGSAENEADIAFWNAIKDSRFEADYRAYLEAFPNGKFAPLARLRATRYTGREPTPLGAPAVPAQPPVPTVTATARPAPKPTPPPTKAAEPSPRPKAAASTQTKTAAPTSAANTKIAEAKPRVAEAKPSTQVAVGIFPPDSGDHGYRPGKKLFRDCASCPEMVVVERGSFTMGVAEGDATEKPAHRVTFSNRFAIGRHEVTLGEWSACVADGACAYTPKLKGAGKGAPVRNLSWNDTREYTRWLSGKTGADYRLPSEAEWEYAARAGTATRYWWGDQAGRANANCADCGGSYDRKKPSDVGQYKPNAFGLYDMHGGVSEWVADCWIHSHAGAPSDGAAQRAPNCAQRVLRGGSWRSKASDIRSTIRFFYDASVRYYTNGFRVARTLK